MARIRRRRISGTQGYGCCPAHDDDRASLSIRPGDKHRLVFFCQAGCDRADIRYGLLDLGIPPECLGDYGMVRGPVRSARERGDARVAELERKLERIRSIVAEPKLTPSMRQIEIQLAIEGGDLPRNLPEFSVLAVRAGVSLRAAYKTWAQVSGG